MVGLRATLGRLAATTPHHDTGRTRKRAHPRVRPVSWVIDGGVAHRVALTVGQFPGSQMDGRDER
jgi:hypothetical protein